MTRRFLLLHGLENRRPREHWQWWLAEQLRRRGEQVLYPQLPDPDYPDLSQWLDLLTAEYAQLGDSGRVVICHSLACALWYQASRRAILELRADLLLLVAPPGPSFLARAVTADFYDEYWDPAVLRGSAHAIRLVASDVDRYCPEGPAARVYGQPLGLDTETTQNAGHLARSDGYGPWPGVLRWCLDPSTRITCAEPRSNNPSSVQ